jgi:hypothetical protein
VFCENCGLQFFPNQSVCTRCGATSTRHCFQLTSLATLLLALACNCLAFVLFVSRRVAPLHVRGRFVYLRLYAVHAWLWMDAKAALYGWAPLAVTLLIWDYFAWPESRPILKERIKRWAMRVLLVFALASQIFPFFPRSFRARAALLVSAKLPPLPISFPPAFSSLLPWLLVSISAILLCIEADTRDSLLGRGRVLGLISLVVLSLVLGLNLLAFAP